MDLGPMGEGDSPIPLHPAHYAKESGLDNIPTKGVIIFPCGQVKTLKTQLHIYTLPTHVRPEIPQENHHVIIMVKITLQKDPVRVLLLLRPLVPFCFFKSKGWEF